MSDGAITVNDKVSDAIKTLQEELGFDVISVWAPGAPENEDADVQAIFFAKDDAAMLAAVVDFVQGDKAPS